MLPEGLDDVVGVGEGVALTALERFFRAARCGRGLIAREVFSEVFPPLFEYLVRYSFSSSELLNGLRAPVLGEGGFSTRTDFGRYLGRAEAVALLFGRSVDPRAPPESRCLAVCPSADADCSPADIRLREMVLESGVQALEDWGGDLTSPMEVRGAAGMMALRRRDEVSFPFCAFLSGSLGSLFMTSTKALPARFSDCRMDLEAVGRSLGPVSGGGLVMKHEGGVYDRVGCRVYGCRR